MKKILKEVRSQAEMYKKIDLFYKIYGITLTNNSSENIQKSKDDLFHFIDTCMVDCVRLQINRFH